MAQSDDRPVCGFIGLGSQGAPMARRMIDAGFITYLWARRPETLEPYRETAARFAGSVAELGAEVDHLGLCVVTDQDVRQVCDQLIPAMRPGSRIAIHSTVHPDTCRAVEAQAAARGVRIIDAPVSGGAPGAQAGTMAVMVGGDPADLAAARPVFETFGRLIVHLGPVGAGQHAKLINNTLMAANLGLANSALEAGQALGMNQQALVELLQASSGRSFALEVRGRMTDPTSFSHGGSLLAKDVRLLGEVLGQTDPAFAGLRDAALPFLDIVLEGRANRY
ncbi:NAD(P)-dependent oxidoreductase [Phenylobacterium sp. LjRoot225]|uniref:NAD(P)-dependent oxidoreductase n=1 Tax=Phenylobacterium sp. LjRoot225 TaxID=3342285 RepID=UPI003ECE5113